MPDFRRFRKAAVKSGYSIRHIHPLACPPVLLFDCLFFWNNSHPTRGFFSKLILEDFTLPPRCCWRLGCFQTSRGIWWLIDADISGQISVSCATSSSPVWTKNSPWTTCPCRIDLIGCPEKLVINHPPTRRNITEKQRPWFWDLSLNLSTNSALG